MTNHNVSNISDNVSPKVAALVQRLYSASDVGPAGHHAYVDLFAPDAILVMGAAKFDGHDGILSWRQKGWEAVSGRLHIVQGVFAGKDPKEVMTYGTVNYDNKDGTKKEGVEWAAHLVTDGGDEPKIKFYQVYIVSRESLRGGVGDRGDGGARMWCESSLTADPEVNVGRDAVIVNYRPERNAGCSWGTR